MVGGGFDLPWGQAGGWAGRGERRDTTVSGSCPGSTAAAWPQAGSDPRPRTGVRLSPARAGHREAAGPGSARRPGVGRGSAMEVSRGASGPTPGRRGGGQPGSRGEEGVAAPGGSSPARVTTGSCRHRPRPRLAPPRRGCGVAPARRGGSCPPPYGLSAAAGAGRR